MTLNETLKQLKALANESTRAHNTKYGAGDNQFGVKHGDIRDQASLLPGPAFRFFETSRSLQPARRVNAVVRRRRA